MANGVKLTLLFILLMSLILIAAGCYQPVIRFDIICVAWTNDDNQVIVNCADTETWKKWREKQQTNLKSV